MPIHVVARGALIGGGVGAALALVRSGRGERTGSECGPRSRNRSPRVRSPAPPSGSCSTVGCATEPLQLVAERGPDLLDTALELAGQAYDTARPQVEQALVAARPARRAGARRRPSRRRRPHHAPPRRLTS